VKVSRVLERGERLSKAVEAVLFKDGGDILIRYFHV
jgi:hypothetical protein